MGERNYSIPTYLDNLHATAYAMDRIINDVKNNPTIIKSICQKYGGGDDNCLIFKKDDNIKSWKDINYRDSDKPCTNDTDCNATLKEKCFIKEQGQKGLCGFSTNDTTSYKLLLNNKTICTQFSELPYNCDPESGCTAKQFPVENSYLEWREPDIIPIPVEDKSLNKKGTCIYGNALKKKWAENPLWRKDDQLGDAGADDKYQFPYYYDDTNGKIYMTPGYCKAYDTQFASHNCKNSKGEKDDSLCPKGGTCRTMIDGSYACESRTCSTSGECATGEKCSNQFEKNKSSPGVCIDDSANCWTTRGQDVGEFLLGSTIFRFFDNLVNNAKLGCKPTKESYIDQRYKNEYQRKKSESHYKRNLSDLRQQLENTYERFNNTPYTVIKMADSRFIKNKKLLKNDFAGKGINLYDITWNDGNNEYGFIADEIEKIYPRLIIIKNGIKYLRVDRDDIKNDNNIKRIYLISNHGKWFLNNFKNF